MGLENLESFGVQVLVPRQMELCLRVQQLMGCLPALPEGAGKTRCCRQGATRAPAQHQPLRWQPIQVVPQQKEVILDMLGQLIIADSTSRYCHVTMHVCRVHIPMRGCTESCIYRGSRPCHHCIDF